MKQAVLEQHLALASIAAGCVALLALIVWLYSRRLSPAERERRRRLTVNLNRRTVEGFITEASAETIHFQYEISGVAYFTAQDVSTLAAHLPPAPERLIGPAGVKYDPKNPANSIVLCEEWSGLPVRREEESGG